MNIGSLPFNWFDLVVVVVLLVGVQRGRSRGMSEELMSLLKWLAIVFGCALLYRPVGDMIAATSVFSQLSGYLMAYLGIALIIAAAFALFKKYTGEKLVGSDVFGRTEFYLGMLAGMLRWSCMLVAVLALLNARDYTPAEVNADVAYQNDVYGSTYFPKLYSVQAQVFKKSLVGPWIKDELSPLLIKPTVPQKRGLKQKMYALP